MAAIKKELSLKLSNYVVFDCETGGLDKKNQEHAKNHPITQIAIVSLRADNLQELDRLSFYLRGQLNQDGDYVGYDGTSTYQEEALKFTGITIERLEDKGVDFKTAAQSIFEFLSASNTGSHVHKPILVGHNVTYDIPFLQKLMSLAKLDLSKVVQGYKDHEGNFHPNYLDTMWLSRMKWGVEGEKHNLTETCNRAKVDLFDAHSAVEDTLSTAELFRHFVLSIRSEGTVSEGSEVSKFRDNFQFQW